jgi:alpha-L-rhamnosidase
VKITHLKTNHIVNPLGFGLEKPTFSWIVEDTSDKVQTAAQVLVSCDGNFEQLIFDSGKVEGAGIDSVSLPPTDLPHAAHPLLLESQDLGRNGKRRKRSRVVQDLEDG